jgi:YebC/PmpR family DNA-binding regulatory protein
VSGHSKWSKLKRTKGAIDSARGAMFTKMLKEIGVAARIGGGDPTSNHRLRAAIDKAKGNSVPKDAIERQIAKATGETGGDNHENLMYEGYGQGGVAILVACLTDNRARTIGEVRSAFNKGGGTLGAPGSVAYMFQQKAVFVVPGEGLDEDTVMTAALDGGADDVSDDGDGTWSVTADFGAYGPCKSALDAIVKDGEVKGEISWIADNLVAISLDDARKLQKLLQRIEDCDDVQETFTNADISEDTLAALDAEE